MNVLIIEDNIEYCQYYKEAFTTISPTSRTAFANNGAEAMNILDHMKTPDIIILDLHMPVVNGFQLFKQLKTDSKYQDIPVFIVSGHVQDVIDTSFFSQTIFCNKPTNLNGFKSLVTSVVNYVKH